MTNEQARKVAAELIERLSLEARALAALHANMHGSEDVSKRVFDIDAHIGVMNPNPIDVALALGLLHTDTPESVYALVLAIVAGHLSHYEAVPP